MALSGLRLQVAKIRTLRRLGARSLALAALHRTRSKSGAYCRRAPVDSWRGLSAEILASARSPFQPPNAATLAAIRALGPDVSAAAARAGDRILSGEALYFSREWLRRPANWATNPLTGHTAPSVHWARLAEFDPKHGDIKYTWEPSRFEWVFQLARAWAHTGNEAYVAGFWDLLADWRLQNPPNRGTNWKCGQECSLRLMTLVWAAGVFRDSASSTPERLAELWETVARLAERIWVSLGYALAQANNHALSEAAALYAAGVCLPAHPRAGEWRGTGWSMLRRLIREQFAEDGSYIQHSHNYTRLALRVVSFALLTARLAGDEMDSGARNRLRAAGTLLYQMQDAITGRVPNYGANDGANYLALSACDYSDYRPLLQTMAFLLDGDRWYPAGPWDEELLWHCGASALELPEDPPVRGHFAAPAGGYYILRDNAADAFAAVRCHTYRTRPAHADALHVDYWYGGCNVLVDAGTYSYNTDEPWSRYFRGTASHNTVMVDGLDQMIGGSRFLWLDWVRARTLRFETGEDGAVFEAEHSGYDPIVHRRRVELRSGLLLVIDDLSGGDGAHDFRLQWAVADGDLRETDDGARLRLPGLTDELRIAVAASGDWTSDWARGEDHGDEPRGWQSRHYGERVPAWSLHVHTRGKRARFVTLIGPAELVEDCLPLTVDGTDLICNRAKGEARIHAHA